jgi:hypothetical protein
MDDLELLRGFRADAPELIPAKADAIRRAYRAPAPRKAPRRRHLLALGGAVAVAAAAIVLSVSFSGEGTQQTAAAATLRHAASRLDGTPVQALAPGSYWYVRTQERVLAEASYSFEGQQRVADVFTDDDNEQWVKGDGRGAEYGAIGAPFALTAAGSAALAELDAVHPISARTSGIVEDGPKLIAAYFGSHAITSEDIAGLPVDIASLRAMTGEASAARDFWAISEALFLSPYDARLDAALYRLAAQLPGVQQLASATDSRGRTGVTLGIVDGSSRWALTIDPATGRLLERSETKVASGSNDDQVPVGTVTWRETVLATAIVPALAARPDGTRLDTSGWTVCKPIPGGSPSESHCVDPKR